MRVAEIDDRSDQWRGGRPVHKRLGAPSQTSWSTLVSPIANTEIIKENGTTTYRRTVAGAIVRFEPDVDLNVANSPRAYRFTDHLGSPVALHRIGDDG